MNVNISQTPRTPHIINENKTLDSPKSPKLSKSPSKKKDKIEKPPKDFEMIQQSLLVTLLIPYCEIIISKPLTKTKTIPSIFKIQRMIFQNEDFDFKGIIEQRIKDVISGEIQNGIEEYKAKRHSEINRSSLAVNMLFDLCLEFGYLFTIKKSRKTTSTIRIDRIEEVYFKGELYLNKRQVEDLSVELYSILNGMFQNTATISIPRNCPSLVNHLNLFFVQSQLEQATLKEQNYSTQLLLDENGIENNLSTSPLNTNPLF